MLLDRMLSIWNSRNISPKLRDRLHVVSTFARGLRALGPANFLYSDGDMLFAHGHRRKHAETGRVEAPGLVLLQRQCEGGGDLAINGVSIRGDRQLVAMVASVPLAAGPWSSLSEGEIVVIARGWVVARELPAQPPILTRWRRQRRNRHLGCSVRDRSRP